MVSVDASGHYPKIGKAVSGHHIYELVVNEFVEPINPPSGIQLEQIDPNQYFITSGDAIQKTKYMAKVLWAYAGRARKILKSVKKPPKDLVEFEKHCWKQAGGVNRMLAALIRARGKDIFLETERNVIGERGTVGSGIAGAAGSGILGEHQACALLVVPKNPRANPTRHHKISS